MHEKGSIFAPQYAKIKKKHEYRDFIFKFLDALTEKKKLDR
jgi:hypothetical protein